MHLQNRLNSADTYLGQPCERCGSKKRIAKKWKEKVPTFNGSTTIEYTQIICTNKACQKEFNKKLLEESKKREERRIEKEANLQKRKSISLSRKTLRA